MGPTNCGALGHGDALRLPDHLLHLQQDKPSRTVATAGLMAAAAASHAPDHAPWRQDLQRLLPFEVGALPPSHDPGMEQ